MTIKQLTDKLTHVTLVNPSDLTSEEHVLPDSSEIANVMLLCKCGDGTKRSTVSVRLEDVMGDLFVDQSRNEIGWMFNLTKVPGLVLNVDDSVVPCHLKGDNE